MPTRNLFGQASREALEVRVATELAGVAQGPKLLSDRGMWVTFLAREPCCGARVFLNVRPRSELDDNTTDDILRAAERNRGARHPAVLPVRRFGCTDELLWITTRAYRGRLLSHSLSADRAKPQSGAFGFVRQVVGPLEAVHRAGFVHGALSGSAFHCDIEGRVRIRNLEIETPILRACLAARIETEAGMLAAPEVRQGLVPGPESDQHALAAMVVTMLGCALPAKVADLTRQGVSDSMARALVRALAPRKEERFASVGALAEALDQEAIEQTTDPAAERSRAAPTRAAPRSSPPSPGHLGDRFAESWERRNPEPEGRAGTFGGRALATTAVVLMFSATLQPLMNSSRERAREEPPAEASIVPGEEEADEASAARPESSASDEPSARADSSESAAPGVPVRAAPEPVPEQARPPVVDLPQRSASPPPESPRPSPDPTRAIGARTPSLRSGVPPAPRSGAPARPPIEPIRPSPVEAPTPAPGGLSVQTYPWGAAYVDDAFVGNTPLVDMRVSSGFHTLRIERSGYEPYVREVTVRPGQVLRVTGIVLQEGGR